MLLLGAGIAVTSRGSIGAATGVVLIVVGVVWKLVATGYVSRRQAQAEESGSGEELR